MPLNFVSQMPELIEMRRAAVRLPSYLLQAVDIEIDGAKRMPDTVRIAFAIAPDAAVNIPAE
jgi:hypothetical protein